jgi:hypothetical protein
LAYLSRYTHRVAISNSRLISADENGVTFKWKDYRRKGRDRYRPLTLTTHEFIRRFLSHVLPKGLHRIRHYGLFANGGRAENLARARQLLGVVPQAEADDANTADATSPTAAADITDASTTDADEPTALSQPCPCCGGRLIVIETFAPGCTPRHAPPPEGIDSS